MVRIKPTVILGREAGFSEEGVHYKLHNMNINGHRFLERTKILRKNEIFRKKWCRPKKTNNGRTTWIVQRNEKTIWNHSNYIEKLSFFYWTNKLSNNCFEQIKNIVDFLNERFYWSNKINFFWTIEKNEWNGLFTNDERIETRPSLTTGKDKMYAILLCRLCDLVAPLV